MEWKGKTALITGGVSGIGFGIARAFSAAGIDLILTYRNEEYRIEAETWFKRHSRPIPRFVALDVTDRGRWAEIAVEAGSVHILVNNAGVSVFGPTDAASFADYDWIMGVNLGGVVNGLVTFIPRIKAQGQGGHIVNVASMAAYLPGPQAGIYTASKFAVRGLTESLRFNLAPHGIGVSLMCPGLTKTNAWDSARVVEARGGNPSPAPRARIRTCRWNWRTSREPAAPRPSAPSPCSPRHAECRPRRRRDRPHRICHGNARQRGSHPR